MNNRAMICLPDTIEKRITNKDNWLTMLTLRNSCETRLDYTILIPEGEITNESEDGITFRDYHQKFYGFEFYSDFKENISKLPITSNFRTIEKKIGDVGFAVYAITDKTSNISTPHEGYALLYFFQILDSKNTIDTHIETHLSYDSFNKIWGELNPHLIDLEKLIKHIFPELQSESNYKNLILHVLNQHLNNLEFQKNWHVSKFKGNKSINFRFFQQNITILINPKQQEIIKILIAGSSLFDHNIVLTHKDVNNQINFQSFFKHI